MQRQRPIAVILLATWFFLAGIIAAVGGVVQSLYVPFDPYLRARLYYIGLDAGITSLQWEITRRLIGVVLITSGLGYCAGAIGLLQGREWGRRISIVFAIVATLGWIGTAIFVMVFWAGGNAVLTHLLLPFIVSPIVIGVISGLPVFYLMGDQVRVYGGAATRSVQAVPSAQQETISSSKRLSWPQWLAIIVVLYGIIDLGDFAFSWVFAGVEFVIAWGLWQARNWARIGLIILVVVYALLFMIALPSVFADQQTFVLAGLVIGLAVRGVIIYWLAMNGKYFK